MKKVLSKSVSLLLAALMVFTFIPMVFANAASEAKGPLCGCGYAPTIHVTGVNTKDIQKNIGTAEQKVIFPPSMDDIKSAVLSESVFTNLGKFLITQNWDYIGDALIPAANSVFADGACDNNGNPKAGTGIDWDYNTAYIPQSSNHRSTEYVSFYYDWRIDPMVVAQQLDVFINRVCVATGHTKVNLDGFSMGSVIVMAYIAQYGYNKLEGVLLSSPAFNGTVTCGEPYAKMIDVDGLAVARFMDEMLDDDVQGQLIKTLINLLYKTKVIDGAGLFVDKLMEEQGDRVYNEAMLKSLATMPGLWGLIPDGLYEKARDDLLAGDARYTALIQTIDNYHNNVQEKGDELIAGLLERNIKFGIISKYGSQLTPCIDGWDLMGDSVIDTKGTSFGATCATLEGTLGENYVQKVNCGHNHISPDNQIDASTCKYPEYTWFVRELMHSNSCPDYDKLCDYILNSGSQVTVRDSAAYPQFLLYNKADNTIVPMTAANCALKESIADYSLLRTIRDFGSALVTFIKSKNEA